MADIIFFVLKLVLAVAVFAVIMRFGMVMLGGLARKHEPPEAGELRRVNLRYRCSICLTEVKMVQASEELPMPPRHCQEDMDLFAGPYD
ncbi:MAG: hypothetical protein ABR540_17395 [Acidimicrobiales bacterium]|nr:hypothetical protein [Actinomycetota bacterium]